MLLKSPVLLESELAAIQLDSQLKTCTFQLSFQVGEGGGGRGGQDSQLKAPPSCPYW